MTSSFRSVAGPLHAEVAGVEGMPRLVFVHGFTQTAMSWRAIAECFADRHEIVLVDAPGHGGSSHVRADLDTTGEMIADIGGRATYIGYSMGGRMVLHTALSRPDLLDGLVLVSATGGIDDEPERAARRASDEQLAAEIERDGVSAFMDRWLALPLFAGLAPDAADIDDRLRNTVDGLASSLALAGTGTQMPLWDRLHTIECPTLVITGANDEKFTQLGGRLVAAIGTHASHVVIPDAGHAVHLESPEAVTRELTRFLSIHRPD
jgi:2-succinyl-6-hydroxy-2,4-cyclohexadiene-1-carboxylate synthase